MNGYIMKALEDIIVPEGCEEITLSIDPYKMTKDINGIIVWRSMSGEKCPNPPYQIDQTSHQGKDKVIDQ
jgi:hypothetical protein